MKFKAEFCRNHRRRSLVTDRHRTSWTRNVGDRKCQWHRMSMIEEFVRQKASMIENFGDKKNVINRELRWQKTSMIEKFRDRKRNTALIFIRRWAFHHCYMRACLTENFGDRQRQWWRNFVSENISNRECQWQRMSLTDLEPRSHRSIHNSFQRLRQMFLLWRQRPDVTQT